MIYNNYDINNELTTEQYEWVRLFDLPGVRERITDSPCGGENSCGKCRVMVLAGECSTVTAEEKHRLSAAELEHGIRLACYCRIKGTIKLRFAKKAVPQILVHTARDNYIDFKTGRMDGDDHTHRRFGMAMDLGTTTVVGSLFNLKTGQEMQVCSRLNPQTAFGLDVMSRINFSSREGGTEALQNCILDNLDDIIGESCARSGVPACEIEEIVITGNTVMLHILAGVNPSPLGCFPYTPAFTSAVHIAAHDLGLKVPYNAAVYMMPSASAFIGADIVAGILATDLEQETDHALLLDLGTNGEMVLFSNNRLWACSVAVGPALEGMNIECGMRAEAGAVDRVWLENETLNLHVIGGLAARGLCGSGLLETVGTLIKAGIVAANGRLLKTPQPDQAFDWSRRVTEIDKSRRFWLKPPSGQERGLFITQNDIRQLQLTKGAICAGIELLLRAAAIQARQVKVINLTGALGNYLNPGVLVELGILPPEWQGSIRPAGNSALQGAIMALMSDDIREQAEQISRKVTCLDLTASEEFEKLFVRSMSLG